MSLKELRDPRSLYFINDKALLYLILLLVFLLVGGGCLLYQEYGVNTHLEMVDCVDGNHNLLINDGVCYDKVADSDILNYIGALFTILSIICLINFFNAGGGF